MKPILFTIGPLTVASYPLMICLGACAAIWLTLKELKRLDLDYGLYLKLSLIAFSAGIIGARIMNNIVFYDLYKGKPFWKMLAIWEGGLAMYGGIILALALIYIYVRFHGLSFWEVADILSPPWTMLLVFGRLGCFLNGCCYGKPTTAPVGIFFKESANVSGFHVTTHPTQLYSAFTALIIFLVMWRLRLRSKFTGQVVLTFFLFYPIARFIIEYFRADPRGMWRFSGLFTLSESQIISIFILLFALIAWPILSRRQKMQAQ